MQINAFFNTIRSSFFGALARVSTLVASFIVRTVLIYKLGLEYVGLNSLFVSIFSLLNITELGIGSAIVFTMYKPIAEENYEEIGRLLNLYRRIYTLIGALIFTLGLIVMPLLRFIVRDDVPADINIYVLYVLLLLNTASDYFFTAYKTALFSAYQRNDIRSKILMITELATSFLQIILMLTTGNYYLYVLALLSALIPRNLLYSAAAKKEFPYITPLGMPDKVLVREIVAKVIPLLGHKVGATFLISLDSIIISAFLGLKMLGIYNNYYYIITAIMGFTSIVQQSLLAGIGNKIVNYSKEQLLVLYGRCSFAWRWIVGSCAICFACLFQNFIELWIGVTYLLPGYVMISIVAYYYCWQFRVIGLTFKDAAGLWKEDWIKPYIGMILNAIFSISLVKYLGDLIGVLLPTSVIMAGIYFPWESNVISQKLFSCKKWKIILPAIRHTLITATVGAATYLICASLGNGNITLFILKVIIALILPNAVFLFLFRKRDEYQFIKWEVTKLIVGRIHRG